MLEKLNGGSIQGKTLNSLHIATMEAELKKNIWINAAELFFDNNDILKINVTEREPIARIFTTNGLSFYLDSSLAQLPLSNKFSARVPVFTNFPSSKIDSNLLGQIKTISTYILNDQFWMAQIEQVDITGAKTFEIVPKIGNHIIVFGNAENYQEKFNNLLIFYKQVETKVGWNKYSRINIEYKAQVVAVKRGAEDVVQDSLRAKQLMIEMAAMSQKQASDSISNIQLAQPQDDNTIPLAPEAEYFPDEKSSKNALTVLPQMNSAPVKNSSVPLKKFAKFCKEKYSIN